MARRAFITTLYNTQMFCKPIFVDIKNCDVKGIMLLRILLYIYRRVNVRCTIVLHIHIIISNQYCVLCFWTFSWILKIYDRPWWQIVAWNISLHETSYLLLCSRDFDTRCTFMSDKMSFAYISRFKVLSQDK